jgi:hypothetical protein
MNGASMRTLLATLALVTAASCVSQDAGTGGSDTKDTGPVPTDVTGWTSATAYTPGATLPAWTGGGHMYILSIRSDLDPAGTGPYHGIYAWIMVDGSLLNDNRPVWIAQAYLAAYYSQVTTQYYGHVNAPGNDGLSIHSTGAAPLPGHGGGPGGGDPGGFHFSAYYVNNVILGTGANEMQNFNTFSKDLNATWGVGAQAE